MAALCSGSLPAPSDGYFHQRAAAAVSQPEATAEPTAPELAPPVQKKQRANRKRVDSITLVSIAQYFHLPIKEASKALQIGVSALKGKCRQYGIPRWPHRKIKSLDSLIHDLEYVLTTEDGNQDEWLQNKNAAAINALKEKKRLLESEKEAIRQKPALGLRAETKLFRQLVFKRRNKAQSEGLKVQRGINSSL